MLLFWLIMTPLILIILWSIFDCENIKEEEHRQYLKRKEREKIEELNKKTKELQVLVNENHELTRKLGRLVHEEKWDLFMENLSVPGIDNKIRWVKKDNVNLRFELKVKNHREQPKEVSDRESLQKVKRELLFLLSSERQTPHFIEGIRRTIAVIESLEKSVK